MDSKLLTCYFLLILIMFQNTRCQNPFLKDSSFCLNHLGTKTPYRFVANMDTTPIEFKGCEPQKIWMIIRHGTRNPSPKYITEMNKKLPKLKDKILQYANQLDINIRTRLQQWKPVVDEENAKILTHEGEDEMIELAERMQLRFPTLLPKIYSNTSYKFRFTATQRTKESARYFAVGLFGRQTSNKVWFPVPVEHDIILRFYKMCSKWKKNIKQNPETLRERNLFITGTYMKSLLKAMGKNLGFIPTFDDVHLMYMSCAFETAWNRYKQSVWCSFFNKDMMKAIEYTEDLTYYWVDGYGYKLSYLQACPAIKNLIEFFESKDKYPKAILYFTHSGTILKLLAHLGLYKDSTPLQHNSYDMHQTRKWRVSKIDSFASNIAFILFKCGQLKKLLILHQERPVHLPSLKTEFCDLNNFVTAFNNSINNCNLEDMCALDETDN